MLEIPIELFLIGLGLGFSQCLIACAPILLIYVAGTTQSWREGLKATLIFSFARLTMYVLLGLLAGLVGGLIIATFEDPSLISYIWLGTGIFIFLVGILMVLGKSPQFHFCQLLMKYTVKNSILSMGLLGLVTAIPAHCPVFLLAILSYIAFMAREPLLGGFYGFCFGLGASIITPLLPLGVLASVVPRLVFRGQKIFWIFQRAFGFLFLLLGVRLIFNTLQIL